MPGAVAGLADAFCAQSRVLPMMPGVPERRSSGYVRHGTIDLFAALNIATGKVIGKLSAQHRAVDFRDFLDQIDRQTALAWPST